MSVFDERKVSIKTMKTIIGQRLIKNVHNKDIVLDMLVNIIDGDNLLFLLDVTEPNKPFKVKRIGDWVKFKPYPYGDEGEIYELNKLEQAGLYKDGYMFGRVSGESNSHSYEDLRHPYSKYIYVDQLVIKNANEDPTKWEVGFLDDQNPRGFINTELYVIDKSEIPYYGKNQS